MLSLLQQCGTCGAARTDEAFAEASALIAMFGVADDPYAVCPTCRREIHETERSSETYRRRVRVAYLKRGVVLRQDAAGRWRKEKL